MFGILGFFVNIGLAIWKFFSGNTRKDEIALGAAQQRDADRKVTDKDQKVAADVKNRVASSSNAAVDQLSDKWTLPDERPKS